MNTGVIGRRREEIMVRVGMGEIVLCEYRVHCIFVLLIDGNIVRVDE